jgi:hypothetical protein
MKFVAAAAPGCVFIMVKIKASLGRPRLLAQLRAIKKMLPGIYMKFTLMTPKTGDAEHLCLSSLP